MIVLVLAPATNSPTLPANSPYFASLLPIWPETTPISTLTCRTSSKFSQGTFAS
ncbi:hypothetical protein I5E97_01010 [Proteus hauseri]|uniref:hypothetical protein n=1 Tax=Proteus cibi TaxID=2050966 RepID=UPI0013A5BD10|nr:MULTISPECIES: hypothetical protein [Proteus]MBG6029637.1 hypothetical protein [Proteus hauseri]